MPIKKRKPNSQKFVYHDGDILVIKTPADCTNWPNEFRKRLITNYVPPRTLKQATDYERHFKDNGYQTAEYKAQGRKVMVRQPTELIEGSGQLVVLRTEVIDVKHKRAMFLYHEDPAMRVLMTFAFLEDKLIGGVPKLEVYDYDI